MEQNQTDKGATLKQLIIQIRDWEEATIEDVVQGLEESNYSKRVDDSQNIRQEIQQWEHNSHFNNAIQTWLKNIAKTYIDFEDPKKTFNQRKRALRKEKIEEMFNLLAKEVNKEICGDSIPPPPPPPPLCEPDPQVITDLQEDEKKKSFDETVDLSGAKKQDQEKQNQFTFSETQTMIKKEEESAKQHLIERKSNIKNRCDRILHVEILNKLAGLHDQELKKISKKDIVLIVGLKLEMQFASIEYLTIPGKKFQQESMEESQLFRTASITKLQDIQQIQCFVAKDEKKAVVKLPFLKPNAGNAISLSNQLLLQKIKASCREVQVLLLINYTDLESNQALTYFQNIYNGLKSLVTDIDKNLLSIQVRYTNASGKTQKEIKQKVKQLLQQKQIAGNSQQLNFLKYVYAATNSQIGRAINEKEETPEDFLESLFSPFHKPLEKTLIQDQLTVYQKNSVKALLENQSEIINDLKTQNYFEDINYIFESQKVLQNTVQLSIIQQQQQQQIQDVLTYMDQKFNESIKHINNALQCTTRLTNEDQKAIHYNFKRLKEWDRHKSKYFSNKVPSLSQLEQAIKSILKTKVLDRIANSGVQFQEKILLLSQLQQFQLVYPPFDNEFKEAKKSITQHLASDTQQIIQLLEKLFSPQNRDDSQSYEDDVDNISKKFQTLAKNQLIAEQWIVDVTFTKQAEDSIRTKATQLDEESRGLITEHKNCNSRNGEAFSQQRKQIRSQTKLLKTLSYYSQRLFFTDNELVKISEEQMQFLQDELRYICTSILSKKLSALTNIQTNHQFVQDFADQRQLLISFFELRQLDLKAYTNFFQDNNLMASQIKNIIAIIQDHLTQQINQSSQYNRKLTAKDVECFKALLDATDWLDNYFYKPQICQSAYEEILNLVIGRLNTLHERVTYALQAVQSEAYFTGQPGAHEEFKNYCEFYQDFLKNNCDRNLKESEEKWVNNFFDQIRKFQCIELQIEDLQGKTDEIKRASQQYNRLESQYFSPELVKIYRDRKDNLYSRVKGFLQEQIESVKKKQKQLEQSMSTNLNQDCSLKQNEITEQIETLRAFQSEVDCVSQTVRSMSKQIRQLQDQWKATMDRWTSALTSQVVRLLINMQHQELKKHMEELESQEDKTSLFSCQQQIANHISNQLQKLNESNLELKFLKTIIDEETSLRDVLKKSDLPGDINKNIAEFQKKAGSLAQENLVNIQTQFNSEIFETDDLVGLFDTVSMFESEQNKYFHSDDHKSFQVLLHQIQQKINDKLTDFLGLYENKKDTENIYVIFSELPKVMPLIDTLIGLEEQKKAFLDPLLKELCKALSKFKNEIGSLEKNIKELGQKAISNFVQKEFSELNATLKMIRYSADITKYFKIESISYYNSVKQIKDLIIEQGTAAQNKIASNCFDKELADIAYRLDKIIETQEDASISDTAVLQNKIVNDLLDSKLREINTAIINTHALKLKQSKNEEHNNNIGDCIYRMVEMCDKVTCFQKKIMDNIEQVVKQYIKEVGFDYLLKLGKYMQKYKGTLGNELVQTHPIFKNVNASAIKEKNAQTFSDKYVFENMKKRTSQQSGKPQLLEPEQIEVLRTHHQAYEKFVDEVLKCYLFNENRVELLICDIEKCVQIQQQNIQQLKSSENKIKIIDAVISNVIELLAKSFTLWTFKGLGSFFGEQNIEDAKKFIQFAHASQIISIFLILGIDNKEQFLKLVSNEERVPSIENNLLIECLTGQGKSILLSMAAIQLANLGFYVDIGCYSKVLTDRDQEEFSELFTQLKVKDKIRHNTITELAGTLMDINGDIRQMTAEFMLKNEITQEQNDELKKRRKMLLLDECDMFYSPDFYGQTYDAVTSVLTPDIKEVIMKIWSTGKVMVSTQTIRAQIEEMAEYKALQQHKYFDLFKKHFQLMIAQVGEMSSYQKGSAYFLQDGMIGYKIGDAILTGVADEYRTVFAYIREWQENNITEEVLHKSIGINVACGNFSYAELLKEYEIIKGVSGTLQEQSGCMRNLMREFISKEYYAPSMFLPSHCKFDPEAHVKISYVAGQAKKDETVQEEMKEMKETEEDDENASKEEEETKSTENQIHTWHLAISEIVTSKLQNGQSVLVFFKSNEQLNLYLGSEYLKADKEQIQILNEQTINKYDVIKKGTRSGMLTLCIREFGRGSNFIPFDEEVIKKGGVVVIQTFFSIDKTEEIQIKGRTARQSSPGEYYISALAQDVAEDLGIPCEKIVEYATFSTSTYINLNKEREVLQQQHIAKLVSNAQEKLESHNQTIDMQKLMLAKKYDVLQQKLIKIGCDNIDGRLPTCQTLHFIFILDMSGSMRTVDAVNDNDKTRWELVVEAFRSFIINRKKQAGGTDTSDVVTTILYDAYPVVVNSRALLDESLEQNLKQARLKYVTHFHTVAGKIIQEIESSYSCDQVTKFAVMFLSDGEDNGNQEELDSHLTKINDTHSDKISCWWNVGFGPESANGSLKAMTSKLDKCNAQYKAQLTPDELKQEFVKLSTGQFQQSR